jgi:hypothetical protein
MRDLPTRKRKMLLAKCCTISDIVGVCLPTSKTFDIVCLEPSRTKLLRTLRCGGLVAIGGESGTSAPRWFPRLPCPSNSHGGPRALSSRVSRILLRWFSDGGAPMNRTIATMGKGQAVSASLYSSKPSSPNVRRVMRHSAAPNTRCVTKRNQDPLVWLRTLITPMTPMRMIVKPVAIKKYWN